MFGFTERVGFVEAVECGGGEDGEEGEMGGDGGCCGGGHCCCCGGAWVNRLGCFK